MERTPPTTSSPYTTSINNYVTLHPNLSSVRKERKIRPGFTPQEDVARFRTTRQQAVDARALPKGHIPGWAPPGVAVSEKKESQSKSAKKNEKRKEKRKEKRQEVVQENWDSEADDDATADKEARTTQVVDDTLSQEEHVQKEEPSGHKADGAESGVDTVVDKLDKLAV
jgi:partner of Y14 and mago